MNYSQIFKKVPQQILKQMSKAAVSADYSFS